MTRRAGAGTDGNALNRALASLTATEAPETITDRSGGSRGLQRLVLEGYPSLEQQDLLGPNSGSRRWGVADERKNVQQTTWAEVKRQGIVSVPPPVHVTYRFVVPDRIQRDWDNFALICKPVQDGLVKAGVLVGDHYAVLSARVEFVVEKGSRRLEIEIAPRARSAGDEG